MNRAILATRIGAALLLALGVARGIGGVILFLRGRAGFPHSLADDEAIRILGAGLLLVAVLGSAAAVLLYRLAPSGFPLAVATLIAFLVGGLVNGSFLFGRPTAAGTTINLAAAALILAVLLFGRPALRRTTRQGSSTAPPTGPAA